jgi:hypothetical protein
MKEKARTSFLKKRSKKFLLTAVGGTGSAFNRHQRWQLKALPVPAPPVNKKMLLSKSAASLLYPEVVS